MTENGFTMYYAGDDSGPTRPMTHEEMVQSYNAMKPDDLLSLADLYIDFRDVGDVEFLVFKDRLSAAVLMTEVATSSLGKLEGDRRQLRATRAHRKPGWEAESDLHLDGEQQWIATTAQSLMYGAALMAAVAALEALIDDLRADGPQLQGLARKAERYLSEVSAPPSTRVRIEDAVRQLARQRNAYAHSLDGSPWSNEQYQFTAADCERVFRVAGRLAVDLTLARDSTENA